MIQMLRGFLTTFICPKRYKAAVLAAMAAQVRADSGRDNNAAGMLENLADAYRKHCKFCYVEVVVAVDLDDCSLHGPGRCLVGLKVPHYDIGLSNPPEAN